MAIWDSTKQRKKGLGIEVVRNAGARRVRGPFWPDLGGAYLKFHIKAKIEEFDKNKTGYLNVLLLSFYNQLS